MYKSKSREGLLEKVYNSLQSNTPIENLYIPHSDVFYVREALEARFKCELSLLQVEEYMNEAGWSDSIGNTRERQNANGEEWS